MNKIEWSEEYSVGVENLDSQHKKIIDYINILVEIRNISVASEAYHDILKLLMDYAKEHLDYEEKLLKENGYHGYENHSEFHSNYLERVTLLSMDAVEHIESSKDELLNYLTSWWKEHILVEDMKFKPFFEEKGIK